MIEVLEGEGEGGRLGLGREEERTEEIHKAEYVYKEEKPKREGACIRYDTND